MLSIFTTLIQINLFKLPRYIPISQDFRTSTISTSITSAFYSFVTHERLTRIPHDSNFSAETRNLI